MLLATVEKMNQSAYKKVYREVTAWLDRHENELIPQVSVSSKKIIFDEIVFNRTFTQNIQLQNIGKSPVQYQIIDSRIFSPDRERYPLFTSDIGLTISHSQVWNYGWTHLGQYPNWASLGIWTYLNFDLTFWPH